MAACSQRMPLRRRPAAISIPLRSRSFSNDVSLLAMSPNTSWGRAAQAALLLFLARGSWAASLDVSPVRIDLAPATRSAELRLTNTSSEALSVQVDAREWSQDFDGDEQLVDTRALLAVPPIVTIPPGERQIVRIGHLGAPAEHVERSFRLLVTELSGARAANDGPALSMRIRLSIPVFVAPSSGKATPAIDVEDVVATEDGARLTLHNTGNAHAKIDRIEVRRDGEWDPLPSELFTSVRYLLPDARAVLALPQEVANVTAIR